MIHPRHPNPERITPAASIRDNGRRSVPFVVTATIETYNNQDALDAETAAARVLRELERRHGKGRVTITEVERA